MIIIINFLTQRISNHCANYRKNNKYPFNEVDRDSSVGIATRYGMDGPGTESQWGGGEISRNRAYRPWGPTSLMYNGYRVLPGGKKRQGHAVAQLVEALLYKPEGSGFDFLWCHWNFSLTQSFWPQYGPGVDSTSNGNENQE